MSGSRAEDSGKSSDRLVKITKNVRTGYRALQKKTGTRKEKC